MFGLFNKVTDPVCKMKVDKNKAKYSSEYKQSLKFSDENYKSEKSYFCSENCKNQSEAKPEDFVKENAMGSCCQNEQKFLLRNKAQVSAPKSCC